MGPAAVIEDTGSIADSNGQEIVCRQLDGVESVVLCQAVFLHEIKFSLLFHPVFLDF